jgi:hypothetical protein
VPGQPGSGAAELRGRVGEAADELALSGALTRVAARSEADEPTASRTRVTWPSAASVSAAESGPGSITALKPSRLSMARRPGFGSLTMT